MSFSPTPALTVLVDADCTLCKREGRYLEKLDNGRGRLRIAPLQDVPDDIRAPIEAAALTRDHLMAGIHAVTDDGRILVGMAVFRRAYALVGRGWLYAPTGWPLIRPLFDTLYRAFAKRRVRISTFVGKLLGDKERVCASDACAPGARPTHR